MDEVAFQDWPGPPVDMNSGNNPWMPAYGFQTPSALLEKEDFIGNPDADYFLNGPSGQYMYLETIQEETSDDLRSDSDVDSRNSPVGWLATDSEDGSVICMDQLDDVECESDREIACPPKRRKQENCLSLPSAEDDDELSLSRSSSLLQFETLEKECQESQSPRIFSQFSFEPLDIAKAAESQDFSPQFDVDIFQTFGNELTRSKQSCSRDSLLYNVSTRYSSSDSSDSDTTVENSRSCDNLKTWRSFDSLQLGGPKKFSSENLSEDSGYGDQLLSSLNNQAKLSNSFMVSLSSSTGNLLGLRKSEGNKMAKIIDDTQPKEKKNSYVGFGAYDCDVFQNFNGNFGVSYQDLSIFDRYDPFSEPLSKSSPLTDMFLRRKQARQLLNSSTTGQTHAINLNINLDPESGYSKSAKFSGLNVSHAASVPNLLQNSERLPVDIQDSVVSVCSVPKDLNFLGEFHTSPASIASVAEKNWNLADLSCSLCERKESCGEGAGPFKLHLEATEEEEETVDDDHLSVKSEEMASYRREGSYSEAMSNRVDLSDDENSLRHKVKLPKSPIVDFDRKVLRPISEQSLHSLLSSTSSLQGLHEPVSVKFTPVRRSENKPAVAVSTPDLNRIEPVQRRDQDENRRKSTLEIAVNRFDTSRLEEERSRNILLDNTSADEYEVVVRRKGSIIKSSTSTSGMSDIDEKTMRHSVKSFSGSTGSKGVHFSPVVAEVNWQDDASNSTVTPDRDSLYSLNSSSPEPISPPPKPKLLKPKPQYANRRSVSQPDLSDNEATIHKREFIDSLHSLRQQDVSKSQPDVSRIKRRGSQLVRKDVDGCTVKAYIDVDGVQYRHTHLDLKSLSQTSLAGSSATLNARPTASTGIQSAGSKNSLTSRFPFYHPQHSHGSPDEDGKLLKQSSDGKQVNSGAMAEQSHGTSALSSDTRPKQRKNKSGLGGFLQRLASFRLGAKKGQDQKEKLKRNNGATSTGPVSVQRNPNQGVSAAAAPKPDYIYIPLKGPMESPLDNNNSKAGPVSAAKPPLPKQPPPRVVHASVKKTPAAHGVGLENRRRRRTIDSASGAVDPRGGFGNASMDGPMGLIETDLDTEVTVITNGANPKARSLLDLGQEPRLQVPQRSDGSQSGSGRPHKSMEFLLDKQNLKVVEPPENELQKTERIMSEHELRIQRSLQKLTVPEWYKNSQVPGQGFLLKKQQSRESRWTGTTGSKTTSLSSLGSGTQSPLVLSPTPSSQPFVRWSTSKLNSTASSPCQSTRSSFNQGRQPNGSLSPSSARSSFNYRQPYMGWRSQERLNRPRTPAERLASTLLSKQNHPAVQQESPEIQTSIKEVTSAIVHYVSGLKPASDGLLDNPDDHSRRSSSVSPRGSQKLCWLESSFVGTKPLDSPETPVTCSESPGPPQSLRLDLQNHSGNGKSLRA